MFELVKQKDFKRKLDKMKYLMMLIVIIVAIVSGLQINREITIRQHYAEQQKILEFEIKQRANYEAAKNIELVNDSSLQSLGEQLFKGN